MATRTALFVRRYGGVLGGHVKVFDYARHIIASRLFETLLYVVPGSGVIDEGLVPAEMRRVQELGDADLFFVGGLDWEQLDRAGVAWQRRPVVNLIQGFRHVVPGDPRHAFFSRPALRICVSNRLFEAVVATGLANGPVAAIENGVDLPLLECAGPKREPSIFIAGGKNATLAFALAARLRSYGLRVDVQTEYEPRVVFLNRLRASTIAVLLPHEQEGFFLPALEAMALGCVVVVPDCLGTQSYCLPERTALVPKYTLAAISDAVVRVHSAPELIAHLRREGYAMAALHSLERERTQFLRAFEAYLERWSA